jgi:hypothetical protein
MKTTFLALKIIALFIVITFPFIASASEKYSVSAIVTDSIGTPEMFATVRIYSVSDSINPVALCTTNDNGQLSQQLKQAGKYQIVVAAVNKSAKSHAFEVTDNTPDVNLGTLILNDTDNNLNEIVIEAQRPLVHREIDRIAYDVAADPDAITTNLREILRKVPMVTVDANGNILVKGSSDFKIYKNGHPNNNYEKNAKDIFTAIPASTIRSIEVITDPGAREDAEGSSAILNIVTDHKSIIKGILGTATLDWTMLPTNIPTPVIYFTTQLNKVTMSASVGYKYNRKNEFEHFSTARETTYNDGTRDEYYADSYSPSKYPWANIEASWEPDSLNLFTVELDGVDYRMINAISNVQTSRYGADGTRLLSYSQKLANGNKTNYTSINGSFNYQRSTHRKGEAYTLSYMISNTDQKNSNKTEFFDKYVAAPEFDLFNYSAVDNSDKLNYIEHTIQADWTRRFGSKHKLDIGAKAIFRNNHALSDYIYAGDDDLTSHNDFTHRTTIAAVYTDYRFKWKKLTARAGIRYEYSHLSAEFKEASSEKSKYAVNLNDYAPNVAISYDYNDASTFKLSYNRSIKRPSIGDLDPSINHSPLFESQGNDHLNSVANNNVSLNYSVFKSKIYIDATLSGRFVDNNVTSIRWADENGIVHTTKENLGVKRVGYLGLYLRWNLSSKTSVMFNLSSSYTYREQPESATLGAKILSRDLWDVTPYLNVRQRLPWWLSLSVWASWSSGNLRNVYTYTDSRADNISYGFYITRNFLKDMRLSTTLSANNIFGPNKKHYIYHTYNPTYTDYEDHISYAGRTISISISYRFGDLNASVKKTKVAIKNNDLDATRK